MVTPPKKSSMILHNLWFLPYYSIEILIHIIYDLGINSLPPFPDKLHFFRIWNAPLRVGRVWVDFTYVEMVCRPAGKKDGGWELGGGVQTELSGKLFTVTTESCLRSSEVSFFKSVTPFQIYEFLNGGSYLFSFHCPLTKPRSSRGV